MKALWQTCQRNGGGTVHSATRMVMANPTTTISNTIFLINHSCNIDNCLFHFISLGKERGTIIP